jgi:hypothetical protein
MKFATSHHLQAYIKYMQSFYNKKRRKTKRDKREEDNFAVFNGRGDGAKSHDG